MVASTPPPAREREIALPAMRLAARQWGPDDGPRVLALHGWLDNAASFDRLAPLLPGLSLVAVDLPGHGRSQHRPAAGPTHFVDWVPEVVAIADALGWSSFALLGHSMGAGIASMVPAVAPGRVERLALIEGVGPLAAPPELAPERLRRALSEERWIVAQRPRLFPDLDAAVRARIAGSRLDPDSARILVERAIEATPAGLRFTHDPLLKAPSRLRLTEEQVLAFLAAIDCPVLAIKASDGWPFPGQLLAARLELIRQLRVAEVPGDHHVHLTRPELVAPLVREFLGHPAV